jgi:antitoxin component of RelBE/YafQ-DinJ toxin-antitoxin module
MLKSLPMMGGFFFFLTNKLLTIAIPLYTLWYMNAPDKTIINIKISKSLKLEAQELADEIGVPLSTVVIANLKDFVRSRSLTISALPRLKPQIEKELGEAISDYRNGRHVSKKLSTTKEVTDYLSSL